MASGKGESFRLCNVGYACGDTCITKKKVCLKKLGSNRAKEVLKKFAKLASTLKPVNIDPSKAAEPRKTNRRAAPDLISDV